MVVQAVSADDQRVAQRMAALTRANEARLARAALKRQLKRRELTVREALGEPHAERIKVGDLLESLPAVGPIKRDRILRLTFTGPSLNPSRRVGELTAAQRGRLLAALEGRS